jgi:hypothetical protein
MTRRRDPTRISVEPFAALKSLELRGCDLSTANWDGLPLLQVCSRCSCTRAASKMRHGMVRRHVAQECLPGSHGDIWLRCRCRQTCRS